MRVSMMGFIAASFLTVAFLSAPLHADLTPEQEQQAGECIRLFSSRLFKVRQEAVEKLVRLGPDVVPLIRKTLAEAQDNEVKLRCEMVLKGIRRSYIVGLDDKLINVGVSRHTLEVKDEPLGDLLDALARASGNSAMRTRGTGLRKKPVTLKVDNMPYWQVIDEIRKAAGLIYAYDYTTGGLLLRAGRPKPEIGAYPGPTVVKLNSISRSVTLLNGVNTRALSVVCMCLWEDRLPVTYGKLVLTKVRTKDGVDVEMPRATARHSWWDTYTCRQGTSTYKPPKIRGETVDVEGFVRLEFAVGRREARIEDLLADGEKTIVVDGLTLNATDVRQWDREVRLTVKGLLKPPYPSLRTLSPAYGLFLRDPSDKLIVPRRGASTYVAGGFNVELVFETPRQPGRWSLVLVYPERTETRDYPFELKNVPMP